MTRLLVVLGILLVAWTLTARAQRTTTYGASTEISSNATEAGRINDCTIYRFRDGARSFHIVRCIYGGVPAVSMTQDR